jgi:hypothetical protein
MSVIERCSICHEEHDRNVHCLVPVVARLTEQRDRAIGETLAADDQLAGAVKALREIHHARETDGRQPAAVHIRARDLREGDVVIGQGTVAKLKPYPERLDKFIVTWDRSLRHTHECDGSWVVLLEVDGA